MTARQPVPHDTQHTVRSDWPLALGIDDRGRSIHVCGACGTEIPDGSCVERTENGVRAWAPDGTTNPPDIHRCGD